MRSSNKPRGKSVVPSQVQTPAKAIVTFANAKNRIEGMSNLLGNIAEARESV
jgi:hypothetical protein